MSTKREHSPSKSTKDLSDLRMAFSIEAAKQIVEKVGRPASLDSDYHNPDIQADVDEMVFAQLAYRLNNAAFNWAWAEREQTSASPKMKVELARRVAAQCENLLSLLTNEQGDLVESLGSGGLWAQAALSGHASGKEAVSSVLKSVGDLHGWATDLSARESRRANPSSGRQADRAFHTLISTLAGMYLLFWHQAPGLSRPDQVNPDGPFFRFVSGVADVLDLSKTDEAIATAISRNEVVTSIAAMGKSL